MREVLIVIELALSLALLGAASLLIQSFWRLLTVDPGFAPDHIISAQLALPSTGYSDKIEQINALNGILEAAGRLPGTADISGTDSLPLSGYEHSSPFQFEGKATPIAECPRCSIIEIFPGYFATMRIRLLQGRDFTGTDDATHPPVVIINQKFAKQFFPGQSPIGRRVGPGLSGQDAAAGYRLFEIIGIVNDFGPKRLDSQVSPTMYVPYGQSPSSGFSAVVRTGLTQQAVEVNLRRAANQIDKGVAIYDVRTMDRRISDSVAQPRVNTALISTFAALAIILTATGLYGVMSYSVAQRTQEIGVRLALGASTRSVLQLIIGQGMKLVWIGLTIGILLSFVFNHLISSLLFGIQPTDIPTLLTITLLLTIVALIALWLPAHRASRIDPVVALRGDA
jgi:putative ABC transport system permease protein